MQGTMQVRWRTERPDSGYEALTQLAVRQGSGIVFEWGWRPITRGGIEGALNRGEMVTWNPIGSGR